MNWWCFGGELARNLSRIKLSVPLTYLRGSRGHVGRGTDWRASRTQEIRMLIRAEFGRGVDIEAPLQACVWKQLARTERSCGRTRSQLREYMFIYLFIYSLRPAA
jgi:hypothetical protein